MNLTVRAKAWTMAGFAALLTFRALLTMFTTSGLEDLVFAMGALTIAAVVLCSASVVDTFAQLQPHSE